MPKADDQLFVEVELVVVTPPLVRLSQSVDLSIDDDTFGKSTASVARLGQAVSKSISAFPLCLVIEHFWPPLLEEEVGKCGSHKAVLESTALAKRPVKFNDGELSGSAIDVALSHMSDSGRVFVGFEAIDLFSAKSIDELVISGISTVESNSLPLAKKVLDAESLLGFVVNTLFGE
jgi:hypothetical protein